MATPVHAARSSGLAIWRTQPILVGALAGIAGGVIFGLMMAAMMPPMIGMIGSLVGMPQAGWLVHLGLSAIIGVGFGLLFGGRVTDWAPAVVLGLAYGFVWWILGPLLIMPTLMGMGPMFAKAFEMESVMSLVGHLLYGAVLGLAYRAISR